MGSRFGQLYAGIARHRSGEEREDCEQSMEGGLAFARVSGHGGSQGGLTGSQASSTVLHAFSHSGSTLGEREPGEEVRDRKDHLTNNESFRCSELRSLDT